MTTFHTKKEKCPCCGVMVEITVLTSTNTFGGQTTDFRTMSVGFDPLRFMVNMCQQCGYASMRSFSEVTVSDELRAMVRDELTPYVAEAREDVSMQYAFCARIAEWEAASLPVIASYYMRAAWCCDAYNLRQHEASYRLEAADYFQRSLEVEDFDDKPQVLLNTMYLIGEMYRRANELTLAEEWFNSVIQTSHAVDFPQGQIIADLARQQRDNPKDRIR